MNPLFSRLDHLVYVTPDVSKSIQELSSLLGVTAAVGGQHPIWGTRNALLALGPKMYFEIMGPDPALSRKGLLRPFSIDQLQRPRLATWVARSEDLDGTVESGLKVGVDLGKVLSGSRTKPDGTALSWKMTDLLSNREGGIIPYFINWGDSLHPAESAPSGCVLKQLKAKHPNPHRIRAILGALDLEILIEKGKEFELIATIETSRGLIEIL